MPAPDNGSGVYDPNKKLEEYTYLGVVTVVVRNRPEPGTKLTYIGSAAGAAGDKYTGLDRFGRVIEQRWLKGTTNIDSFIYGYDLDGNRLFRQQLASGGAAFSDLYQADGAAPNAAYDNLNRMKEFQRGSLNAGQDTISAETKRQTWTLDALGNWSNGPTATGQTNRTHDRRNRITAITGATTPAYDANGNLTTDERNFKFTYDAWNRLVQVKNAGGTTVVNYVYDALGRRMVEMQPTLAPKRLYYSLDWQVVEEQKSDTSTGGTLRTRTQYVWGLSFVDEMVLRDDDADGNSATGALGKSFSGLERRVYAQQDANYNVTSLTNTAGTVVERYVYEPYGTFSVKNNTWATQSPGTYNWQYLHQGGRYDANAGLYHFRNREYSATLGRWLQPDPAGYVDGGNLYQYLIGRPVNLVDPSGLTVSATVDAGGSDSDQSWVGAPWTYIPGGMFGPDVDGWTQLLKPEVHCSCDPINECKDGENAVTGYNLNCDVRISAQIRLRRDDSIRVVKATRRNPAPPTLTAHGAGVYGHEQRHVQDYQDKLQTEAENKMKPFVEQYNADGKKDCEAAARRAEAALKAMLAKFISDRDPKKRGRDDITHGPGLLAGTEYPPIGTPGSFMMQ